MNQINSGTNPNNPNSSDHITTDRKKIWNETKGCVALFMLKVAINSRAEFKLLPRTYQSFPSISLWAVHTSRQDYGFLCLFWHVSVHFLVQNFPNNLDFWNMSGILSGLHVFCANSVPKNVRNLIRHLYTTQFYQKFCQCKQSLTQHIFLPNSKFQHC